MASVGYDSTIRLWNLTDMSVSSIIEEKQVKVERDGQINAVSWSPHGKDNLICIATVAGSLKMFDTKRGKLLSRIDLTSYTIFETDWNKNGIVACSENGNVYFISYDQTD
jgi:WD40 repeat protein